ncbi:MAG TPA: hypothetical protein DEF33_07250 [Clostridiales bacterium]|nr:hypothetical protein [Clostridiales bacterium]
MKCTSCGSENVVFMKFNGKWQCTDCGAAFNAAPSSSANSVLNSRRNNSAAEGTAASGASTNSASASSEAKRLTEEIAKSCDELQSLLSTFTDIKELRAVEDKILSLSEQLAKIDSNNPYSKLLYCHQLVGIAENEIPRDKKIAMECLEKCYKMMHEINPNDITLASKLNMELVFYSGLCRYYSEDGDLSEAMRLGKIALESGIELVHEKPNEQEGLFGLVKLLVLLGDVATKAKGTYAAIDYYEQAVDFGTRLLDINPNDVILLASLAHPLEQAGLSALSNGDWATAEKYLSEAVTVIHKMADVNGMFKREYAFTLTKLGTAKEQMEKLDEALQCYTMAMQITEELLSASPDDGKLKWNMYASYEQIGHIAELKHNYREAELLYRQSVEICRTNVKLGTRSFNEDDLAIALYRLGALPLQRKATDEQKECLKEAMSIWKDLYDATGDNLYKKRYDFAKKALRR